jgi:hypothetical protein
MKKTRKKIVPTKTTKETKRKDEIDKENLEKVISNIILINLNIIFMIRLKLLGYLYQKVVIPNFQQL